MYEQIICKCGEQEQVQIWTEQHEAKLCSDCYEEEQIKQMKEWETEIKHQVKEYEQSRL